MFPSLSLVETVGPLKQEKLLGQQIVLNSPWSLDLLGTIRTNAFLRLSFHEIFTKLLAY